MISGAGVKRCTRLHRRFRRRCVRCCAASVLEMARAGITTVGEFHYLHYQSDGGAYDDPSLLARVVIQAARDVGLRIVCCEWVCEGRV